MPNVCRVGSSFFSSRTTSDAWRSPDASPATTANFTPALPVAGLLSCSVARWNSPQQPSNRANKQPSFQWERIHHPRQRDPAEKQRAENQEEKSNALLPCALPQQRKVHTGGDGIDEHQQHMTVQQTHSFRPSEISKESSMSSRFINPAVIVNAVPCS